jgi:hypothetical protein
MLMRRVCCRRLRNEGVSIEASNLKPQTSSFREGSKFKLQNHALARRLSRLQPASYRFLIALEFEI